MTLLGLAENQLLELLWFMGVFAIAAMSLNLVVGQAGLFQLGQVGFFAIGGIATVYATHPDYLGLDLFFGIVLGAAFAALAAVCLGLPTLRLRGDYFAIATLGFGVGVEVILKVYFSQGVFNIPPVNPFGWQAPNAWTWFGVELGWRYAELLIVGVACLGSYIVLERVIRSPFGRTLRAVREDELAAQALGKDAATIKLKAFVLSAMFAALAGSLYVHHLRVFNPASYDFRLTIIMLVMVILGGLGSNQGAVVGAVLITILNEVAKSATGVVPARFDAAALNIMLFAALLVVLMIVRPQGLLGDRSFDLRMLMRRLVARRGGTPAVASGGGGQAAEGHERDNRDARGDRDDRDDRDERHDRSARNARGDRDEPQGRNERHDGAARDARRGPHKSGAAEEGATPRDEVEDRSP